MKQKRNSRRAGKGDIQITIYPKTGRSVGRNTGRKKKADVSSSDQRFPQ